MPFMRGRYGLPMLAVIAVSCLAADLTISPLGAQGATAADRRSIQRALDRMTQDDGLPGAAAVVIDRGRRFTVTSGVGDRETGRPMPGGDGHIRVGSNVKTMVAVVVLQLVGEGAVSVDAPVETYLPGVVPARAGDARRITVRHLLQHTSGLHNYSLDMPAEDNFQPFKHYTRKQLLDMGFAKKSDFRPGTGWSYSNTGYVLLGMVIEKVTGQRWQDEVTRRVFDRVGMPDSYFPRAYEYGIRTPHARGYMQLPAGDGTMRTADVTEFDPSQSDANGTGISTLDDLNRFYTALLGGRLLPAGQLARMQEVVPVPHPLLRIAYGLGLGRYTLSCGGYAWGNGGNIEGFQSLSGVVVDARGEVRRAATVVTNTTFTSANATAAIHHHEALDIALCGTA